MKKVFLLILIIVFGFMGCQAKESIKQTSNINGLQPTSSIMLEPEGVKPTPKPADAKQTIKQADPTLKTSPAPKTNTTTLETPTQENQKAILTLFYVNTQADKLVTEKRMFNVKNAKDTTELANIALGALAKGPLTDNFVASLPKDAPVPTVKVSYGIATVNFEKAFVEKHSGGSTGETMTVYSIVNSLCNITGIKQVQFTIEGKKSESFKGHIDMSKPFVADTSLVQ